MLRVSVVTGLLAAGLVPVGQATAAPDGASLNAPGGATAGSRVAVTGAGFAGQCDVLLLWGSESGKVVGRALVRADGTFAGTVRVPRHAAAGSTDLIARGRAFGAAGCGRYSGTTATDRVSVTGTSALVDHDIPLLSRKLSKAGVDQATLARAHGSSRPVHAIVQLHRLPAAGDVAALRGLGIEPLSYLNTRGGPGSAYIAAISPDVADRSAEFRRLVRAVHPLTAADKIDRGLAQRASDQATNTVVLFFSDVSAARAEAALARVGVTGRPNGSSYYARLDAAQLVRLAAEDAVQFVGAAPKKGQYDNDNSRNLINVDELQDFDVPSATYLGLSGLGVQIGINDSGVDEHHNDFNGRMIRLNHPGDDGDHGTHVAGIAAGSGAMSDQVNGDGANNGGTAFQWRGMAPQAEIAAYDSQTADDVLVMLDEIVNEGVDVSNHSYSYNDGQYDATMVNIDTIIRGDAGIPARPVVFSAGNQGQAPQFGMNSGYYSLSKSCKNCIMVANLQNTGALNGGSSHGPTPDGRLAPQVGALGTGVVSTGADVDDANNSGIDTEDSYRTKGGTSMATPAVTGAIALLLQQYGDQYGVDIDTSPPLPSTVKAILVQTATDQVGTASGTNPDTGAATAYGAGPDWGTGYGLVDTNAASILMAEDRFLEDEVSTTDVTDEHLVSVVPGQTQLRVTLAWDDLPGTPNADHSAPALVNDLDLLLVGPNGEVVRPLMMPTGTVQFDCDGGTAGIQTGTCNPGADPGPFNTVAAQGTDRLNNLEQVVLANPAPGLWRARVSVLNTDTTIRLPMGGTQSYSLAGVTDDRADLQVFKSDFPDPAIAGEQLYYDITVFNDGPDAALDVSAVDVLPAGVTYVTTDLPGGCVQAPTGTLTCSVGDLADGQSKTFTIKVSIASDLVSDNNGPLSIFNTVSVWSTTPDAATGNNSDTEGTIVEDSADLRVTKLCKPDGVLDAGEVGTCTIYIDNLGPSWARDVVVTDANVSNGPFTFGTITTSQGSCAVAGGVVTCNLGDLQNATASSPGRVTITVEVSATEAVDINDTATVESNTPDPNMANNQAQGTISIRAVTDLAITKTGPATAVAGTEITYNLSITNNGPSTATGVVVHDVVSAGVQILSVSASGGATCNAGVPGNASLPTTCSFGNLAPAGSRTMQITVLVLPGTRGTIHNDARVSSTTFDDDLSNNLDTVATDVEGEADLSITKSDSPDPVLAGEQLTYTIQVTNGGPSTATDVLITDTLPAGTSFVSGVDGNGATVCALVQPGTVVCDLGTMGPGTSKTVLLTVLVAPSVPDGTVLTNNATVGSSTDDPDPSDNSTSEDTTVDTEAELWLDKQGERRSGNPSPMVVYTLVVHNNPGCETDAQSSPTPTCGAGGPSDAQNVVVTDVLPLDNKKLVVQFVSPQCTYTKATHTVVCTSATIPAGASVSFVVEAQVAGSVGTISNTARITSSDTPDPVTGNNVNSVTTVMKGGTGKK